MTTSSRQCSRFSNAHSQSRPPAVREGGRASGQWNLDELKIEFEELILADAPIEISGFSLDEIDQIVIGDDLDAAEQGPLVPGPGSIAVARLGDVFELAARSPCRVTRCRAAACPAAFGFRK